MADKFTMPKGRMTIRKKGGRRVRLWELDAKPGSTLAALQAAYLSGLDAMDRTEARHAANKADKRFTEAGVRDDLLKFVLNDAVPPLHRGRTAIKKARAEVAERKSKLKIEGPAKNDIAAAFRRMEIRTFLRDMKPDQQTQYFAKYSDNLPVEIAQAMIELPAELSGISQSRHGLLTERALNAQFGDAISEIKELEQAIDAAESAVEAARDEVRIEVGINDPAKFNELAAPIEAKHAAPWLRRMRWNGTEEIRTMDMEAGIARLATPEEIANGVFAETLDEYNERKAA
jgi:hypothetical protein